MKSHYTTLLMLLMSIGVLSQEPACPRSQWAPEGTYEFIPQSKVIEVFTTDVLCEIEARRAENEYVEWRVSELTLIRIYPRKEVHEQLNQTE